MIGKGHFTRLVFFLCLTSRLTCSTAYSSADSAGHGVEGEGYMDRDVWQCKTHGQNAMYQEDPAHTHMLYEHQGMTAFATSKDFPYFQAVHSLSRDNCHYFGKVKTVFQENTVELQSKKSWFQKYHTLHGIKTYYQKMAKAYPSIVKFVPSIGKTGEGRDIFAVHVAATSKPKMNKIYVQCLIHAREWVSGSVCQYLTAFLAKKFTKDKKFENTMKSMEFVIVPVVNPDGYVKSMSNGIKTRFWRKNVRSNGKGKCKGVDLNRNFNFHWKSEKGSSGNTCREDYRGPYPQSEPEVQAIVKYIKKISPVVGAVDFHSYSQLVLYPYVWSPQVPAHVKALTTIANSVSKAMKKVHHQVYKPMRGNKFFYPASGTFSDWVYTSEVAKTNKDAKGKSLRIIPISVELRPEGKLGVLGFALPEDQIIPTCQEAVVGVMQFVKEITKYHVTFTE